MRTNDAVTGETQQSPILDSYESYGCKVNALDPSELFKRYEQAGFLYPAKMHRLAPLMPLVLDNWRRGLRLGESIIWFCTHTENDSWGTVGSWRSTHTGWISQHAVSIGSPLSSRAVLLSGAAMRCKYADEGKDLFQQNWFRPNNRFAQKVFGSLVETIGPAASSVQTFDYVGMPIAALPAPANGASVTACRAGKGNGLCDLAVRLRGHVYPAAEELDHDDLLLDAVDQLYAKVGLRRYRRVWLCHLPGRDAPVGAAIAYRGPVGFNFSFIENRCDLLVDPGLSTTELPAVVQNLVHAAAAEYQDFPLKMIPLVAESFVTPVLTALGGEFVRQYSQSIWLKEGYVGWYRHVEKFYDRILRAEHRRGLAAKRIPSDSTPPPASA